MGWGSDSLGGSAGDFEGTSFGGDSAGSSSSSAGVGDNNDDRNEVDDSGYDTSTVGMGTNTMGAGGGESVDSVAVASPNTGRVNTQSFNTSAAQTAGMSRVTVNGKTIAVSPSAINAVAAGRGGSSPVTNAIQSQIVGPAQAAQARSAVSSPIGVTTAAIAPSFAPNLINQPLTVGGQIAVMPYDSYQRSPQQMFGYGGLTASPYAPSQISYQGGFPAGTYNPLSGSQISQFDMGRAPTPAGTPDDRNFLEKVFDSFGGTGSFRNQRAGVFDPRTGTFQQFDGQTTLEKTSDNMLGDFFGNAVAGALGVTPLVGRLDTKEYTPLAGGERLQYSTSQGGLLSDVIGERLIPYSELEARQAQMGGDGDGDQPLIIPQEVAEVDPVTGEPTQFPTHTPRQYKYQPYVGKFYSIPSRFTRPVNLLG